MGRVRELASSLRATVRAAPRAVLTVGVLALVALAMIAYLTRELQGIRRIALPVGEGPSGEPAHEESAGPQAPAVLVLNSYHYGYSWSDQEMEGVRSAFHDAGRPVRTFVEYLDCKHHPRMEHFPELRDLVRRKYPAGSLAVVIAADNPALHFALGHRAELFAGVPIVFCGINGYSPEMLAGHDDVTGVAEWLDAAGTLELALRLHPGTRRVVIFTDFTITGLATRRETEAQLRPFAGRVQLDYMPEQTLGELQQTLRGLGPGTLVLGQAYSLDKDGMVVDHERISRLLGSNPRVPAYGTHEERLGYGIVGGYLSSGSLHGRRAAELALKILAGTPVWRIPVDVKSPNRPMFDYRRLQHFGISLERLPRDAVIVNRPVAFVAEHADVVAVALGLVAILLSGIVVLLLNMQRRTLAEERQRGLQAQLLQAQKMEAVGQLAGGVAHDFNNLLSAVMGYAELLQRQLPAEHPGRALAGEITGAADRGAQLVRGLLTLSRRRALSLQPMDLREAVRGIESIARRLIGEDVSIDIRLPELPVMVLGDAAELEHALINLCTNARDAMPHGGTLTFRVEGLQVNEEQRQALLLETTGAHATIVVTDTGVGIDEATRRQLFQPFFTTKEVGKGTGLGLSTVYGIVQQHHGSIQCDSVPGQGTTFRIVLPCTEKAGVLPQAPERAAAETGSETILLVEDEPTVRRMLVMVLRRARYQVIEAGDGAEAVELFAERRDEVDVVLSDVVMPRMSGPEACQAMRRERPTLPVIFMTGHAPDTVRGRGIADAGAIILGKPIATAELLARVREVLDASKAKAARPG